MKDVLIGDCFERIKNGYSISNSKDMGGIPITRIETIANGEIDFNKVGYADIFKSENYKEYLVKEGDILMSHINSVSHLGKVAICDFNEHELIHGMNLLLLRANEKLEPKYAFYFFKSTRFSAHLSGIINKAVNQASFSISNLKNLQIPLPPLPIQRKIAEVLDKADAIRKRSQQILTKYDQLAQSVFLKMFGDPVKNEKGWEVNPLSDFGRIVTGNTPSRKISSFYSEKSGLEWAKTDNIEEDHYYVTKAQEFLSEEGIKFGRKVPKGSILVACIAGSIKSIGRCAIVDREISFNQQINAITPSKKFNSFFLYWMLCIGRKYIQDHATDGMKRILTKAKFSQILFPNPPIELQNQFASIISQIENQKAQTQMELNRAEELYQSLLQKAFAGELFSETNPNELTNA